MEMYNNKDVPAFVDGILNDALAKKASDVYWLPQRQQVEVRVRVAGTQSSVAELPRQFGDQCLTHIKVLAGLLTYRTQIAQDGVIRRDVPGGTSEMRVASMPTVYGERIAIRILDKFEAPMFLEELGFPSAQLEVLRRVVMRPHGLVVLTGPTGSGKTTSIYALIRELLRSRQDPASIITLEDPVESVIDGVSQTHVPQGSEEWTYEIALRSALRQDVKTLVIGEMRDRGVVNVVLDAALTGHRVISTYHAGDIPSVYARLLHQGFEPFLVASAVTAVVSQRLIRGSDGSTYPVAAVLEPDDGWTEFICSRPGLGDLRKRIKEYPLADLAAAAAVLCEKGLLSREKVEQLTV